MPDDEGSNPAAAGAKRSSTTQLGLQHGKELMFLELLILVARCAAIAHVESEWLVRSIVLSGIAE
jgi:hypothetical protein